ncbi:MAG: response regulator [Acidobacteriaceae bacterium]|nr:response regulator [Acidobacteriaceae bacterium]
MPAHKILCIDDETVGLAVRKMMLESEGFQVVTAADGKTGLQLFSDASFDLVVLDYSMPGMNGGEVAEAMRQIRPKTPIILLSAYVTLPDEHVKLADAYVTKGESTEVLLTLIRTLIGRNGDQAA